jgi:hypothetical protein
MWILFGTEHNGEPFVYFIGIYDDVKLANKERLKLIANSKECSSSDFFIKPVEMNVAYTYDFSREKSEQKMNNRRFSRNSINDIIYKFYKQISNINVRPLKSYNPKSSNKSS